MAEIRIPDVTVSKIIEIRRESDPQKALESIIDLFENYVSQEEKVPTRFDQNSGEATSYEWRPSKNDSRYHPIINLGGEGYKEPEPTEPGLAPNVVDLIKERSPLLVRVNGQDYSVEYRKIKGNRSADYYCSPEDILVKKLNLLS